MIQKKINLIPAEFVISPKELRLKKLINNISFYAVILLIIQVIILTSVFLYFNIELKKNELSVNRLKEEVVALEKSEQKLILAKSKLGKIKSVIEKKSALDNLTILNGFGFDILSAIIEPKKLQVSVKVQNSDLLSNIFLPLKDLKIYKNIYLLSFSYKIDGGYLVDLVFEN